MTTRREIKFRHESAVINAAVSTYNRLLKAAYVIESRPEPPDAILIDENQRTWIEHKDAFYPGWAEDLTKASGETGKSWKRGGPTSCAPGWAGRRAFSTRLAASPKVCTGQPTGG
jgi:hypothetical protein